MAKKFNAYIDGFNLYYGLLKKRPDLKWLDLRKLVSNLFEGEDTELDKVYYFTSKIKSLFPSDKAILRQELYWRILRANGVEIIEGKFRSDKKYLRIATDELSKFTNPPLKDKFGIISREFNGLLNGSETCQRKRSVCGTIPTSTSRKSST